MRVERRRRQATSLAPGFPGPRPGRSADAPERERGRGGGRVS
jgi:hypothetical protein